MERKGSTAVEDVWRIFVGDFDTDGALDVAVQHHSTNFLEIVRDAFGSASRTTQHDLGKRVLLGTTPLEDGDGLVVTQDHGGAASVMTWRRGKLTRQRRLAREPYCPGAEIGDIDGDGIDDLVGLAPSRPGSCHVSSDARQRSLWLRRGVAGRGLGPAVRTAIRVPETIVGEVRFGDLDADGSVDAAVVGATMRRYYATEGAQLSIYFGRVDGSFERPISVDVPGSAKDLFVRDIDGDGHVEVSLTAGEGDRLTVVSASGDRRFSPPTGYARGPERTSSAFFTRFALFDVDADGRLELFESRPDDSGGAVLSMFAFDGHDYRRVQQLGGGDGVPFELLVEEPVIGPDGPVLFVAERPDRHHLRDPHGLAWWGPCDEPSD